jgi:hypothetical protein
VTKMLSSGFHSPVDELPSREGGTGPLLTGRGGDARDAVGACGVKTPSSRSLSYTIIVPSACDTRKRFGEDGTHRTAVQGELEIRPCDTCPFHRSTARPHRLSYLLVQSPVSQRNRVYDHKVHCREMVSNTHRTI